MSFIDFVLIGHILGAGVLIGVVFFSLVLAFRKPLTSENVALIDRLAPYGKGAAGWQLFTGLFLAAHNWGDIKHLTIFWVKLILFVAAGLVIDVLIRRQAHTVLASNDQAAAKVLPLGAVLLALIIIAIVTIGVILVEHH